MPPGIEDTRTQVGVLITQMNSLGEDLKEVKSIVRDTQVTLRGDNGDMGLVGRVKALEDRLTVIFWVGGIILASLLTIVIYHIITVPGP